MIFINSVFFYLCDKIVFKVANIDGYDFIYLFIVRIVSS
jgi:hypothetical protein